MARHYLKFVLALAAAGSSLGVLAGAYLGRELTELYGQFFKLPAYDYRFDGGVVAAAVLLTAGAAVAGTLAAVRRAVALPAAEAMRPEPPSRYRESVLERFGLPRLLTLAGRTVLRRLGRQPVRAAQFAERVAGRCSPSATGGRCGRRSTFGTPTGRKPRCAAGDRVVLHPSDRVTNGVRVAARWCKTQA